MVPQSQAVLTKAEATSAPPAVEHRALQKRWPMALSILGAIGVSLVMWAGIFWLVGAVIGLFR
jgi:hypothetical protein